MKNSALKKAEKDLGQEQLRQLDIICPAVACVWWEHYGWKETRIMRRFVTSQEIWDECAADNDISILQMLEKETGIEMMNSVDGKSYHDLAYFDTSVDLKQLTVPMMIYMRQQQKKWVGPAIMAGICLSLHRDEKWGAQRILEFIEHVQTLIQVTGQDTKRYETMLTEVTGIKMNRLWKEPA